MIGKFCVVTIMSCAIAGGQTLVSAASSAPLAAEPNPVHATTERAALPHFDIVSIKPAGAAAQQTNSIYAYPTGRIFCAQCTLQYLTMLAYGLEDWQVASTTGSASLAADARFDIDAKPPEGWESDTPCDSNSPLADEQRQMLQSLLADRFQLKVHREAKADTVYILQRGDQPLKLEPARHRDEYHWAGGVDGGAIPNGAGMAGKNISASELAFRLSSFLKRPVLDQTGLTGRFDFDYRTGNPSSSLAPTQAVFVSMQAIGLQLTPVRGPVETLIIDHAEKPLTTDH